ncbi:hypothetical protein [Amycolatopsis thermoflava]|uniref:hypothetical protein n=1 Tax=Amycolatopsis thermoflava TaxID=84480 RepID=UPI003657C7F8
MNQSTTLPQLLEQRLSPPRFGPYLAAAGTHDAALRLYQWNVAASGATYEALHLVEVVVRNALHGELEAWHAKRNRGGDSWLTTPPPDLTTEACRDISTARDRAQKAISASCRRTGITTVPTPTADDIVAQLNFGFWRYLVAKRYTHNIWVHALRHAFPNQQNLQAVEKPLMRLHLLRNRIAHLEPIHTEDLAARRRDMIQVVGFVDRKVQSWFATVERVQEAVKSRP